MTGFLAALVARTEGQLPLLERRPRALFEPAQGLALAASAELTLGREGDSPIDPTISESLRRSAQEGSPATTGDLPAPPPQSTRETTTQPVEAMTSPQRRATPPRQPVLSESTVEPAPLPPTPQSTRKFEPAPVATLQTVAAAPTRRPPAIHEDAKPGRRVDEAAPSIASDVQSTSLPTTAASRPSGALERRPTSSNLPIIARANANVAPARRPATAAAPAMPASVHISIGRVEIRAVTTAAEKPRTSTPAAPRLSLDDYLRARNGASR